MVKQDLEDLGMKVNFKPIEFNSLVNKLVSTYDWDMVIMGLVIRWDTSHVQSTNTARG